MKRVLFVDDEAHVLDGLRDLLRRQRREWEMVFALGGEAGVRAIEAQPFDVVVSDMRMPDVDGATLLGLVQERHPETVRIILSGQTELEAALRAVPVAHQFLAKPCDRDDLRRAIERACLSRALLADDAVRRAAGGAGQIPSAPSLYTRLVEATTDQEVSIAEIGALVESDVGKLLLAAHRPHELAQLLAAARASGRPLHAVEQERAGLTHAEIGAYLLTLWGLPHSIVEAVAHHHAPGRLELERLDPLAAVHIADALIVEQEQLAHGGPAEGPSEHCIARLGIGDQLGAWRALAAAHVHGAG